MRVRGNTLGNSHSHCIAPFARNTLSNVRNEIPCESIGVDASALYVGRPNTAGGSLFTRISLGRGDKSNMSLS